MRIQSDNNRFLDQCEAAPGKTVADHFRAASGTESKIQSDRAYDRAGDPREPFEFRGSV